MMNLERDLVFCFIEEDNVQRAYFRVRPLLTVHGDLQEEAAQLWPDNACLRIVPDRNEQHTFKSRMRALGSYCVMDLRGIPADVSKIRTNKNYKPDKGESNQFILYSDTVHPLPQHTFFQVLEGSSGNYAALAEQAITPLFYIREDDTLYGPVTKAEPQQPETAQAAQGTLYPLACPDGVERVLLCIESPIEEPRKEEPLPIGKPLQILDQSKDFEETLTGLNQPLSKDANLLHQPAAPAAIPAAAIGDKPLSGTPLFRANMRTSVPQPKNKLQEVVSAQWRVARNEPPTDPLPADTAMRQVENPVEVACNSLRAAWQVPEAQNQLIDLLLSLDGMRAKLDARLADGIEGTALQKALHTRLEDIEAERLALLLQLDKAKADLDAYRRSVVEQLSAKAKAELDDLTQRKAQCQEAITALEKQQNILRAQCEELTRRVDELRTGHSAAIAKALADAQLTAPVQGIPLRLSPEAGQDATAEELLRRVTDVLKASHVEMERNAAIALLALMSICPRFGVTATSPAAASTLFGNIAACMGWQNSFAHQTTAEQKPLLSPLPAHAAPAVLLTSLAAYAPLEGMTKVLLARTTTNLIRNTAYEANPWPIMPLPAMETVPLLSIAAATISADALHSFASQSAATAEEVRQALSPLMKHLPPLSGAAAAELCRFVAVCSATMDGGFATACDWAILLWLLPMADRTPKTVNTLTPLLQEYPLAAAAL